MTAIKSTSYKSKLINNGVFVGKLTYEDTQFLV